jgi:para-nitrobenzyl esterase
MPVGERSPARGPSGDGESAEAGLNQLRREKENNMAKNNENRTAAITGRRGFLLTASMAGAVLGPEFAAAATSTTGNPHIDGPVTYVIDDTSTVGDTESGKVLGYQRNNIRIFKGIPYAEILSPQGRWMRGSKARPWTGNRPSRAAGPACPGGRATEDPMVDSTSDEGIFRQGGGGGGRTDENCLRINIWTPGLDNKKRNVLFWCHGGGFTGGSSGGTIENDYAKLAEHGDVVVVSMNHRLHALGHLDLTAYGERFAESANVGMLDIVDALQWVRRNIPNFGGDPAKVMIFGHSGGGAKVATLLAMPAAKGLFNRAVIQSPGPLPLTTPEESAIRTATFLKLVDVSPSNIDALFKVPVGKLGAAAGTITGASNFARMNYAQWHTPAYDNTWKPVVDGKAVLHPASNPNAASDVPLMLGTALHEPFNALGHPEYAEMKEPQAREILRKHLGPVSDQVYDIYKAAFPHANPFEVSATARATEHMRMYCVKLAQNRAAFNAAPTYLYWFQWRANILGGRAMSHHGLEIPLLFLQSDESPATTGATPEARALGVKLADTWLQFAKTGDPNNKALPHWPAVTAKTATAMVLDNQFRIDPASDAAAVDLIWKAKHPA